MSTETWLTQEAFDRLKDELADREGPRRAEITNRIALARDEGDLKENGGYHAAREEQGKNEARIRVIRHMLDNAKIGTPEVAEGEVAHGMIVKVLFIDLDDHEEFLLGSREEAAHATVDVYSPTSPLGAAVLGRQVGDETSYETPTGKQMRIKIVGPRPLN